jgi:hypothetical protein
MKTGITIIRTVQTGMDSYKDIRTTKIFNDDCTILEIKQWISNNSQMAIEDVRISAVEISDMID